MTPIHTSQYSNPYYTCDCDPSFQDENKPLFTVDILPYVGNNIDFPKLNKEDNYICSVIKIFQEL